MKLINKTLITAGLISMACTMPMQAQTAVYLDKNQPDRKSVV